LTAKYSFNWAYGVLNQVKEKYPRGLPTVCRILRIAERNLAAFIANGDELWPILRKFIKYCELCHAKGVQIVPDYEIALSYRKNVYGKASSRLTKPLTSFLDGAIIQEQSRRGGSGGLQADGTLPFVLEDGHVQYTLFGGL